MFHLFKHSGGKLKGKYDIALVVRGRYIVGSSQGYNKKSSAFNAIRIMCMEIANGVIAFQDDTFSIPVICQIDPSEKGVLKTDVKPRKPYTPNSKK